MPSHSSKGNWCSYLFRTPRETWYDLNFSTSSTQKQNRASHFCLDAKTWSAECRLYIIVNGFVSYDLLRFIDFSIARAAPDLYSCYSIQILYNLNSPCHEKSFSSLSRDRPTLPDRVMQLWALLVLRLFVNYTHHMGLAPLPGNRAP